MNIYCIALKQSIAEITCRLNMLDLTCCQDCLFSKSPDGDKLRNKFRITDDGNAYHLILPPTFVQLRD
jgi:hypothetical protein